MKNKNSIVVLTVGFTAIFLLIFSMTVDETDTRTDYKEELAGFDEIDKINAKHLKKRDEIQELKQKAINEIVLVEFQEEFHLNLSEYVNIELTSLPNDLINELPSSSQFHPRYTLAFRNEIKGFVLHKDPNSGNNQLVSLQKAGGKWIVTDTDVLPGKKYTAEYIQSVERRVEKDYEKGI
ncbi:hypothetical protein [Bacillus sp. SG-1]|uniref:hypothetical protein n=1 Tax=Bacillus sp. SG-1 TaxID=161544 RepID=UPI000154363D|nr:hypothetical protein [Bacillus sp. SG-1]EDL66510.1 hypothetical protein BSG1_04120 [Bacillus sp. SG-1]